MNRRAHRIIVASLALAYLTGCTKQITKIPSPTEAGVDLYEVRSAGAGLAPDSLRIFLTVRGKSIAKSDRPIFEAQDAGSVCYQWLSRNELLIKISSGYVDNVVTQWNNTGGPTVAVRYIGTKGCAWTPAT